MLGAVAATDKTYLLETLARWILSIARTRKRLCGELCLHAHRGGQSYHHLVRAHQYGDRCAGVLPGADYPVMALAQVGMLFELAAVFGRGIKPERGYEVAGVLAGGLVIRAGHPCARQADAAYWVCRQGAYCCRGHLWHGPCARFALRARCRLQPCNEVVTATFSRVRDLVTTVAGATRPMASYEDASDLAA